jgi:hypothetical protein
METRTAIGKSAMNWVTASRKARCCGGVSRSQPRQNDARTSHVGIEWLRALVQRREELLAAPSTARSTSRWRSVSVTGFDLQEISAWPDKHSSPSMCTDKRRYAAFGYFRPEVPEIARTGSNTAIRRVWRMCPRRRTRLGICRQQLE